MRTGTRCTTLVKLPLALSGGSRLKRAPVAAEKLSTSPCRVTPEKASTTTCTGWPLRMFWSCVSLKLPVIHTSRVGTSCTTPCPGATIWPTPMVFLETTPSCGARTLVYERSSAVRSRMACETATCACAMRARPRAWLMSASTSLDWVSLALASCTRLWAWEVEACSDASRARAWSSAALATSKVDWI